MCFLKKERYVHTTSSFNFSWDSLEIMIEISILAKISLILLWGRLKPNQSRQRK
jgi:hypothetical protein